MYRCGVEWHRESCFGETDEGTRERYMASTQHLWDEYMVPFEAVNTIPAALKDEDLGFIKISRTYNVLHLLESDCGNW